MAVFRRMDGAAKHTSDFTPGTHKGFLLIVTPQQPIKDRIPDDTYLASAVGAKAKRKWWVNKRC